jgi:dynein heavy chain
MLNLLTAILKLYIDRQETVDKASFEKFFIYCMSWSVGGLFEGEEREKYQKWIETRNAPLPPISSSKTSVDKETVFDYYVDETTKQWKLWEASEW